jgi:hypothetical protein
MQKRQEGKGIFCTSMHSLLILCFSGHWSHQFSEKSSLSITLWMTFAIIMKHFVVKFCGRNELDSIFCRIVFNVALWKFNKLSMISIIGERICWMTAIHNNSYFLIAIWMNFTHFEIFLLNIDFDKQRLNP